MTAATRVDVALVTRDVPSQQAGSAPVVLPVA